MIEYSKRTEWGVSVALGGFGVSGCIKKVVSFVFHFDYTQQVHELTRSTAHAHSLRYVIFGKWGNLRCIKLSSSEFP